MCCTKEVTLVLRGVTIAALLLVISMQPAGGCRNCHNRITRDTELTEVTLRRMPFKKDFFVSRGWGAGGGNAFTSRANTDVYKKNRIVEMLLNDDDDGRVETPDEPRAEFLRSPTHYARSRPTHRRLPNDIPQLFISSGWGPLGK